MNVRSPVLLMLVVAGCGNPEPDFVECSELDPAIANTTQAIRGGATTSGYLRLSPAESNAMVAVRTSTGEVRCTGMLVGTRLVLTARHCFSDDSDPRAWDVSIGPEASTPEMVVAVDTIALDTEADLALLELGNVVPSSLAVPLAINAEAVGVGELAEVSGFGVTDAMTLGARYFAVAQVRSVGDAQIEVAGLGESGACFGDSGGPLLVRGASGHPAVAGVLRAGSSSCLEQDAYVPSARAMRLVDAIATLTLGDAPPDCGEIDAEGGCFGSRAVWCSDSVLQAESCGADAVCAYLPSESRHGCVPANLAPCGSVDELGECDGDTVVHCSRGELLAIDCSPCGQRCERSTWSGRASCL